MWTRWLVRCIAGVALLEVGTRLGAVARETVRQWQELGDLRAMATTQALELNLVQRRLRDGGL